MATSVAARPIVREEQQPQRPQVGKILSMMLRYILMIVLGLLLFAPFILSFLGSFKTNAEITAYPPRLLPEVWQFQNWPRFFSTNVGGTPRLDGAASFGLMAGLFTTFLTLLLTGLTSVRGSEGLPRAVGLPVSILLALGAGAGSAYYLAERAGANTAEWLSVGIAITLLILIAVLLLSLSSPDWRRVVLAVVWSIAIGAVVTLLFEQLAVAAGGGRFLRWLFNTAVLSVMRACFRLLFCAMAAYAFSRLRFPGRNAVFSFMLATMMIPGAVTLVPSYVLMAKLEWVNRAYSLILPGLIDAGSIFLLTQFLKAVPRDLEEAAYIDGASYFQTFKDVVLPLARPALLTVFILQFQSMWNDYLAPLLYLRGRDMWVLNVALNIFRGEFKSELNLLLVAAILNAVPVLILFFLFSKYYIEGVSYAGVKG